MNGSDHLGGGKLAEIKLFSEAADKMQLKNLVVFSASWIIVALPEVGEQIDGAF